jgi:hypothetical protein
MNDISTRDETRPEGVDQVGRDGLGKEEQRHHYLVLKKKEKEGN